MKVASRMNHKLLNQFLNSDIFAYGVAGALTRGISYLSIPVFSTILKPVELGQLSLGTITINLLWPIAGLNGGASVFRESLDSVNSGEEILRGYKQTLLLIFLSVLLLCSFLKLDYYLSFILLGAFSEALINYQLSFWRAAEDAKRYQSLLIKSQSFMLSHVSVYSFF